MCYVVLKSVADQRKVGDNLK